MEYGLGFGQGWWVARWFSGLYLEKMGRMVWSFLSWVGDVRDEKEGSEGGERCFLYYLSNRRCHLGMLRSPLPSRIVRCWWHGLISIPHLGS